jgi:hypothetical protein
LVGVLSSLSTEFSHSNISANFSELRF